MINNLIWKEHNMRLLKQRLEWIDKVIVREMGEGYLYKLKKYI